MEKLNKNVTERIKRSLPRLVDSSNLVMALKDESDHWVISQLEEDEDWTL
ncbi:MAG: hypothetical protein RSB10_00455 [Clostridia bacterium]